MWCRACVSYVRSDCPNVGLRSRMRGVRGGQAASFSSCSGLAFVAAEQASLSSDALGHASMGGTLECEQRIFVREHVCLWVRTTRRMIVFKCRAMQLYGDDYRPFTASSHKVTCWCNLETVVSGFLLHRLCNLNTCTITRSTEQGCPMTERCLKYSLLVGVLREGALSKHSTNLLRTSYVRDSQGPPPRPAHALILNPKWSQPGSYCTTILASANMVEPVYLQLS